MIYYISLMGADIQQVNPDDELGASPPRTPIGPIYTTPMTLQQFPTSSSSSSSQIINPIIRERPRTPQQLQADQDELSTEDRLAEPLSPRSQRLQNTFKNGRDNEEKEQRKRPPPFDLEQTPQQKIDVLLTEVESPNINHQ